MTREEVKKLYRPFNSKEECFEEMKKHEPFGRIKDEESFYHIFVIEDDCIYTAGSNGYMDFCLFTNALRWFTFMDEEPFGIKE